VTSAARKISRPPSVSVSPNRNSFCTRRSASLQIQRCRGASIRSNAVGRSWGRADSMPAAKIFGFAALICHRLVRFCKFFVSGGEHYQATCYT
jgi:hypothetical protein